MTNIPHPLNPLILKTLRENSVEDFVPPTPFWLLISIIPKRGYFVFVLAGKHEKSSTEAFSKKSPPRTFRKGLHTIFLFLVTARLSNSTFAGMLVSSMRDVCTLYLKL